MIRENIGQNVSKWCKDNGIKIDVNLIDKRKYWEDDTVDRNVYKVKISNKNKKSFTFEWADSIINTENNITPDEYDILSSLTKEDPKSFRTWCKKHDFEICDENLAIYDQVQKEWNNILKIFETILPEYKKII